MFFVQWSLDCCGFFFPQIVYLLLLFGDSENPYTSENDYVCADGVNPFPIII